MTLKSTRPFVSRLSLALATAVLVVGSGLPDRAPQAAVRNAEDLMIVDCLLPGQIRKLGRQATYMSARRPIRTTQADCEIRGGEYVSFDRANYQTALQVWMEQAMAGSAEAQNNVGEIYSKGLGIAPDYGMAFQWFKKAADQGYNRAKINLGYLYETGLGVPKDTAMALNLYREASGIQDELLYSSVVQVQLEAKDEQISGLQAEVQQSEQEAAALREENARLRSELASRRQALQNTQRELADTQARLASARQQQDQELMKLLETQLLSQEQQITTQRTQIASLEQRTGGVAGTGTMVAASGMPTLELLDPTFVATRGRNTAVYRGEPGKRQVVGRVSAPQAIREITVNGAKATVAANGNFTAEVTVPAAGLPVSIVAVDQRGARGEISFTMLPQAAAAGAAAPAVAAGTLPSGVRLGRFFAVVVGNNTYRDSSYSALTSAANDATAVANLLKTRYGYQTTLVLNGSRLEILTALNEMREQLKPEDNLLIYYAGHGELQGSQGYWVPSDGVGGNKATWISNAAVSDMLNTMAAKHILVVADSCYSGTMTAASTPSFSASMPPDKWASWVQTVAASRSRTALTSGGVQPVPDKGSGRYSYFARAFMNVLQDNNRLLEGQRLYREVSTALALSSIDAPMSQSPTYAPIRYSGHESGEFFFNPTGARRTGP